VEQVTERSAIVSFTLGSAEANKKLHQKLADHNIIVALRAGSIRVSPNFFNSGQDIERLISLL